MASRKEYTENALDRFEMTRTFLYQRLMVIVGASVCVIMSHGLDLVLSQNFVSHESVVQLRSTETTIASKRARDAVISLTNAEGKLRGGDNDFCVLFENKETGSPFEVQDVGVNFALQVGKIQEKPIRAVLSANQLGRYCGHVDLGKQYYVPASYYAFVVYTDPGHQKHKERLFLTVK